MRRVRVHHVHPVEHRREQGRLFPARSGPDLHDDVLAVEGVLREQEDLQLLLVSCGVFLGGFQFFVRHREKFRVAFGGEEREGFFPVGERFFVLAEFFDHGGEGGPFLEERGTPVDIFCRRRIGELRVDAVEPLFRFVQPLKHRPLLPGSARQAASPPRPSPGSRHSLRGQAGPYPR